MDRLIEKERARFVARLAELLKQSGVADAAELVRVVELNLPYRLFTDEDLVATAIRDGRLIDAALRYRERLGCSKAEARAAVHREVAREFVRGNIHHDALKPLGITFGYTHGVMEATIPPGLEEGAAVSLDDFLVAFEKLSSDPSRLTWWAFLVLAGVGNIDELWDDDDLDPLIDALHDAVEGHSPDPALLKAARNRGTPSP